MYELIERIAVGGMAEIYLARERDGDPGEYLVVKRILPHFAVDRELVNMFLDEQRVAATLHHENIVRTYDVGEVDGEYFISMEYLHGEDVRRIFRSFKKQGDHLPMDLAINIVVGAAGGLHHAHEKRGVSFQPLNIVHRDVTPHNLIVTYDGVVKLVDFGVAKATNRQVRTEAGTIKGKIPYMSPEQCKGIELDRRSDIYALGIVLYELTTGTRLYAVSGGEFATMRRIVEEPPVPPSAHVPGYPPALERIVLKALEKEPANRYQTALAMQEDLLVFAHDQGLAVTTERLSRFMHELFQNDILAWEAADGDITKLIDQLIAKHSDQESGPFDGDLDDDDIVFHLDAWSASSLRSHPSGDASRSSSQHIGTSLTQSLESVWGAADSTTKSSRRSQTLLFPRSGSRVTGLDLQAAAQAAIAAVSSAAGAGQDGDANAAGAADPSATGQPAAGQDAAGGSASSMRRSRLRMAPPPAREAGPADEARSMAPRQERQSRLPVPLWWVAVLVAGMIIAFLLGTMLR